MRHRRIHFRWRSLWLGSIFSLLVLLSACGSGVAGGASTASSGSAASNPSARVADATSSSTNAMAKQQNKAPVSLGPQYLIKSLKVSMEMKDTRRVANDLQTWITTTDPRATSAGINYEQANAQYYNITLTYSVQASLYPKIQQYLADYPSQRGGRLLSINETVQDVTNNYVDSQSRLKNLRTEQTRLQVMMSQAQAMNDVINVEQRLSDVEGQIESIEAQLNTLNSQITFYPVTIYLQPVEAPPPPSIPPGWSANQTFHDAFVASITFAQGLATFVIWLLAFSIYIIPVLILVWLIRKWRSRRPPMPKPSLAPSVPMYTPTSAPSSDNVMTTESPKTTPPHEAETVAEMAPPANSHH